MTGKTESNAEVNEIDKFIVEVRPISDRLKYPINSFEEFADMLGGKKATVEWRGRSVSVDQAQKLIPSYYFPIESEEDLLTKAINLEFLRPGNKLMPSQMGHVMEASPDVKPPRDEVDEPEFRQKLKVGAGGPAITIGYRG